MNTNFEKYLKSQAKKKVSSFKKITPSKIKVLSNSNTYPNSITISMDVYADMKTDGYILNNVVTNKHYALTAVQLSDILAKMIKDRRNFKPNSRQKDLDLLRVEFSLLSLYEFTLDDENENLCYNMKRNNKRALYESIMGNVAKTVKRTLNEGMYDFTSTNTTDYEDDSLIENALAYANKLCLSSPKLSNLVSDILDQFTFIETRKIYTCAVSNDYRVAYNPDFFTEHTTAENGIVLIHAALHIALSEQGFVMNTKEEFTTDDLTEFNIAIDKIINNMIIILCPQAKKLLTNLDVVF